MKKIIAVFLVALMVFGMTACHKNTSSTATPDTPTGLVEVVLPTPEEIEAEKFLDEKIKMVFENDSITIKMTKIGMDQVSQNVYRFAEGEGEPDEQVVLTQLKLTFYDGKPKPTIEPDHNPEDVLVELPEQPIILTFTDINYDLYTADDFSTTMKFVGNADALIYAFPGELLQELRNRDYGQYCVKVDAQFNRINGENTRICGFDFKGEVKFEEQFDVSAVSKTPATFTDTGATIKFKTAELLTACGIDTTKVKKGDVYQFDFFDIYSSKEDNYLVDENDLTLTIEDSIPDELIVEMKYEDATAKNHVVYKEITKEGERGYVHTRVQWTNDEGEQFAHVNLLLDVTAAYTNPEPEEPSEPTEPTEPSESEDTPTDEVTDEDVEEEEEDEYDEDYDLKYKEGLA